MTAARAQARTSTMPLLRAYAIYRHHKTLVVLFCLGSLLANGTFAIQQGFFGTALQELQDQATAGVYDADPIWWWCLFLLGFASTRALIGYGAQLLGMVLGQKVLFHLRARIFDQVLTLDQDFHRQHAGGELIARTTRDSDKVRDAIVLGTRTLVDTVMLLLGGVGFLWWCHWSLGLVQTIFMLLAIWMLIRQADRLVVLNRATDDAYDSVTQQFTEGVIGIRAIKAFGTEANRFATFHQRLQFFMSKAKTALLYTASHLPRPQFIVAMGHAWCLWQGAQLVADGTIVPGTYVAVLMLVTGLIFRMDGIGRVVRIFSDARSSATRVWEVLDARSQLTDGTEALPATPISLQCQQVGVHIGERPLLADCNFNLGSGEIVAVVGRTGCGKSTLCSLLSRLRDPDDGSITITSEDQTIPLPRIRLAELRRRVQVVYQGSFLFSDSVRNNLLLANPTATPAQLDEAVTLAAADDIIAGLDDGMKTRIGERGVTLSGGQRQRICLARALVAQPDLLILDDATSALDSATEATVLTNIRKTAHNTGVLLIASRLSSVLLADRVLLLDNGTIAAEGTHESLLATNLHYRRLLGLDEGPADE